MKFSKLLEYIGAQEDAWFERIYPETIRELSEIHWTPIKIARQATEFLVSAPGSRVLDIGCGPGTFCTVAALLTAGQFTGIEQRPHLCELAQTTVDKVGVRKVEIRHGNIEQTDFSEFDAFYLFNPFEENLEARTRIDGSVPLSDRLYERYTEYVARQLVKAPPGTRVATYCGDCEEAPPG